jgi:hypothetical protein
MTTMTKIALGYGIALIALGLWGYFGTGTQSPTALIPAAFGIVAVILGLLAAKPGLTKHAMHGAAVLGLLGVILPVGRLLSKGKVTWSPAVISQTILAVLSLVFVALCVKSFVDVRRSRAAA